MKITASSSYGSLSSTWATLTLTGDPVAEQSQIRILVVDDHPSVRRGLTATFETQPDLVVVAEAANQRDAIARFREFTPDVTIMDLALEYPRGGIEAIELIRKESPSAKIIAFSALQGDEDIYRALRAGAVTYLSKDSPEEDLLNIVRAVHSGGRPIPPETAQKLAARVIQSTLTAREVEILERVGDGLRNKEIAGALRISEETVQRHLQNIFHKLQVNDRTRAMVVAMQRGYIHLR
jgi:two-component system NarL family response regulator